MEAIDNLFETIGPDFIVQSVLKQSEQTAILNPESLNTIRISTLFINGRFSICNMVIKMGKRGSVVDNLGAGGLIIGINEDGKLREYAYDNKYNKHYECDGLKFAELRLDYIDRVKKLAEHLHITKLPNMGFVGWDIALNEDNQPVLIEANLKWPGIQFEQLAVGKPLFADRTDEVIKYVQNYYRK